MLRLRLLPLLLLAALWPVEAQAEIQFSGSSFSTTVVTTGTKQTLINDIETALLAGGAGWSTVSGSGTTNLLMLSGTTAQALQIRARFRDNGGTGIQIYMENSTSTEADSIDTSHGGTLLATLGRTYQVIGSEYQFLIYQQGVSRSFVWVGMPFIPAFITTITSAGWMFSNATSDGDTGIQNSINDTNDIANTSSGNYELLINADYWSASNNTNARSISALGPPRLILNGVSADFGQILGAGYRWFDDSIVTGDVYVAWGLTALAIEAKVVGQVWDALHIGESTAINTTATFSTHDFQNVTNSNPGIITRTPRGGIWFAIN